MSLTAGEHYMAVSKMLGHASYVTTLTVYADYITEGDGGKAAPLRRPVPSSVTNVVPMRKPPHLVAAIGASPIRSAKR